ncbi:MAG: hypothetical protein M9921_03545 [Fimbriimonadaceae bacterium]|nr:hypothetical protein [Fimbriimonadaceae bacterium]
MRPLRVTVLGSGNIATSVTLVASLATYFGEHPLELLFWDADEERADLFDRFARLCFTVARSAHELETVTEPEEALEAADRVLVAVDENCAQKFLKGRAEGRAPDRVEIAVERLLQNVPDTVPVFDLVGAVSPLRARTSRTDRWPYMPEGLALQTRPHQILRWIRGEEYVNELLARNEQSPLKAWLDQLEQSEI